MVASPHLEDAVLSDKALSRAMSRLQTGGDALLKLPARIKPHVLRRTVRTMLESEFSVPPHVAEAVLNHKPQGIVAVYNRYDYRRERAEALERWGQYLPGLLGSDARVLPLKRARKGR